MNATDEFRSRLSSELQRALVRQYTARLVAARRTPISRVRLGPHVDTVATMLRVSNETTPLAHSDRR